MMVCGDFLWQPHGALIFCSHTDLKFRSLNFMTKMAYANSADPDQTAPEGAV